MRKLFLKVLLLSALIVFTASVTQKIIYTQPSSDRISGVHQLDNGWIIAGIGLSDRDTQGSEATFVMSKDNGETWKEIWVPEATDMKTYMIQSNGSVVIAVRGDRGQPQVLRSEDYGETWKVALSTEDIYNICGSLGPLYSVIYHKYENKWYVFPKDAVIESVDNGKTWTQSALEVPGNSRNAYYIDETDDMIIPTMGLGGGIYCLRKGAKKITSMMDYFGFGFTAFNYMGNGIMILSEFGWAIGEDILATRAVRLNNELTIFLESTEGMEVGQLITFSVPPNNQFSNYNNTNTRIKRVAGSTIVIDQEGPDTGLVTLPSLSRIYTAQGTNTIYRSTDNGYTWKVAHVFTGCNHAFYVEFSRCFPVLDKGVAYISIAGYEEEFNREGTGEILKTEDYGATWSVTDELRGNNQHRLNAIYVSTKLKDGRLLCGGQYGRIMFTLEN